MIDQLYILSSGGAVLYHRAFGNTPHRRATVNTLIQEYLLEDRAGESDVVIDDMKLLWALAYESGFFIVAIYSKFLSCRTLDGFLQDVKKLFAAKYRDAIAKYDLNAVASFGTSEDFTSLLAAFEAREKAFAVSGTKGDFGTAAAAADADEDATVRGASNGATPQSPTRGPMTTKDGRTIGKRGAGGPASPVGGAPKAPPAATGKKGKPQKVATVWNDDSNSSSNQQSEQGSSGPTEAELAAQAEILKRTVLKRTADGSIAPVQEKVWEGQKRGRLESWLRSYVGKRELETEDFTKIIPGLKEKLIGKNVAVEVAEHVCESVKVSLTGKKVGTFETLHTVVEGAMVEALRRILQPKREINILRSVASSVAKNKPYSIVFCGVNGVGKSTTLSKIAYWLQQNNHSILVAAGDTFRHGAVEQLEVHGRCLGVPIFQLGYGTDPSAVAAAAISQAQRQKTDVVLVDTAGRMQDHEPRMRALAKLIHDNQPDLVLFVGEALVGNNGVDQLRKFNQCLRDFAPVGHVPRGIDGLVLTKFDTIDDKVGATLSMVYELGQPIVFVGVGQTYQDLKVIEPDVVVAALMQD